MGYSVLVVVTSFLATISCVSARTLAPPRAPPQPNHAQMICTPIIRFIVGQKCLPFVEMGSTLSYPGEGCCDSSPTNMEDIESHPECLCKILDFGTEINVNRSINLLQVCGGKPAIASSLTGLCQENNVPPNSSIIDNATKIGRPPIPGSTTELKVIIGLSTGIGVFVLILVVIYTRHFSLPNKLDLHRWRNKVKNPTNMEVLLQKYGCNSLQKYTYNDIKKMTNSFKDTLGQGGFGTVFKGELKGGHLVAVKVLNESKGDREGFINEVVTIGRTNHVNVVSLLGFCIEGTKRALVYEFMMNGSLERFIYNEKNTLALGWEKLYQIALGIARGLEYLHRGCNTRILHFDIKPHNILLDKEFCPKISDFGLAKLCPTKESVVSMNGARGTMGYIAPEVYCRNIGGVSHKSDVYSYGMMVLEMTGGRKNIDANVENTSEVYFPQWIYDQLERDIKVEELQTIKLDTSADVFNVEITKKMIIVALWCIQTHPIDRPSMNKVLDMLEGKIEDLQMPPNPFLHPHYKLSFSSVQMSKLLVS